MDIDWTQAPEWARWHTTDSAGRTWWQKRPKKGKYTYYYPDENDVAEYFWYDEEPCGMMKLTRRPLPGVEVRRGVVVHDLKTWPEYFEATWSGRKPWELRKNDRNYRRGQVLRLREWNPATESYTGRVIVVDVVYVLFGGVFGLPEDYCIMTLSEVTRMVDSL